MTDLLMNAILYTFARAPHCDFTVEVRENGERSVIEVKGEFLRQKFHYTYTDIPKNILEIIVQYLDHTKYVLPSDLHNLLTYSTNPKVVYKLAMAYGMTPEKIC